MPQTYGVPKKWDFICRRKRVPGHQYDFDEIGELEEERENNSQPVYDYDTALEDTDSKAERNIVYNLDKADYYKYPLIIKDIRKEFKGIGGRAPKVACKNFSLRIKKGEMLGLLGPNGAGKTTLISILTGMYPSTRGNAWVAGFDIRNQLEAVQLQIGFCPQFDILWDNMTVIEHLQFYAQMKGITPDQIEQKVEEALKDVLLEKWANYKIRELSGGMRRRVSVAISIVSDPKIIFLDEPSTGLDPENRRQLWDILAKLKGKRAILLTTHSMEEADVLCNRIAIVNNGILRCVAPQTRLKSLYGGGYHLQINCQKDRYFKVKRQIVKRQQRKTKEQQLKHKQEERSLDIRKHPSVEIREEEEEREETTESEENQGLTADKVNASLKEYVL